MTAVLLLSDIDMREVLDDTDEKTAADDRVNE